jgi:hypothetical protein
MTRIRGGPPRDAQPSDNFLSHVVRVERRTDADGMAEDPLVHAPRPRVPTMYTLNDAITSLDFYFAATLIRKCGRPTSGKVARSLPGRLPCQQAFLSHPGLGVGQCHDGNIIVHVVYQ